MDRRSFLAALGVPPLAWASGARLVPARADLAALRATPGDPETIARDEAYWREAQLAFSVDRTVVNLNNGGVSPAPTVVQDATKRRLDQSHELPAHTMWRVLEPRREGVRRRLARAFGVDPEEVAIVRNASEGLQTCQLGLDLRPGDEVLATDQDYPRMLETFRQRERREGIVLRTFPLPVPCEDPAEVVRRYEANLSDRTRMLLVCHVINLTGQVLPVREVCALGRERGIPVVVDGAHALACLDFDLGELGCDYYASSLHKWLSAPHGTGFLYVRRERIPGLWPLMAAPEALADDVRKFEEIGTHPAAPALGIGEALTFHQALGPARKEARLLYLRDRWARRLAERDRVRLRTSLAPGMASGIATFDVDGLDPAELQAWLWRDRRILTTAIGHPDARGIRVSPGVYTTLEELDRFCDAVEHALDHGLPA